MIGKTNIMVTQEGRERYGDDAAVGVKEILQNGDKFVDAAAEFDAERAEESVVRARLQRAVNLTGHATGTVDERKEEET